MVQDPDYFEIKHLFKMKKPRKRKWSGKEGREGFYAADADPTKSSDFFLIETNDFNSGYVPEPKNKAHGLNLHKSYSDISIACKSGFRGSSKSLSSQKIIHEVVDRKRNCRECYRLQHRCTDCTIRYILRLYVQGEALWSSSISV